MMQKEEKIGKYHERAYFDQGTGCTATSQWSKYTTVEGPFS